MMENLSVVKLFLLKTIKTLQNFHKQKETNNAFKSSS